MADTKRIRCVKVCFDDQEMLDLADLAEHEGRRVADMAYILVRRGMYGMVKPPKLNWEAPEADHE